MPATANEAMPLVREAAMPALRMAKTPRIARRLSRVIMVMLAVLPAVLMLVPWTQTVHGTGRAIAFNPVERPQFVVSPIEGRIKKWWVVEGDRVSVGQRIVELVDNDPQLELRLLDEERAIMDRLRAAEGRVIDITARIRNLENSRELALAVQNSILRQEQARVQTFEQELIESRATVDAAVPNLNRQKELNASGLASKRDVELATQMLETAQAKLKAAQAKVALGKATEKAAADNIQKVEADTAAMINLESASRGSAEAEVAAIRRDLVQIQVRIARQRAQYVDSPVVGTVFRLLTAGEAGGILVRPGDRLAILVPDITSKSPRAEVASAQHVEAQSPKPAAQPDSSESPLTETHYPSIVAELKIDGNDLPLVQRGDRVRLQFEGWPAVQFVGWPSAAVGSFGGRVFLVDPTSDDKGNFRILVEPDPADQPWPDQRYLRQGVRAQGWVLLSRVSIGWELWRQLNGFPPIRDMKPAKDGPSLGPVGRKG